MKFVLSSLGLPWWLSGQRIRLQCGRPGFDNWAGKIPWRSERQPTLVFWPGASHGLFMFSPWGRKESDTTERLSLPFPSLHKCLENFAFNIGLCSTLSKMDFRDHHA